MADPDATFRPDVTTVLILNDFAHVQGGASKVAINEALLIAAFGIRVIFLAAVGPVDQVLAASSVETICLDQPQLLDAGRNPAAIALSMWNRPAQQRIRAVLALLDPARTVVHLHGYTKALSVAPLSTAHRMGFSSVCTLHDFFSACPNGAFFDYVRMAPCPRIALSASCILSNCDKRHRAHKLFRIARSVAQRHIGEFPRKVGDFISPSLSSTRILCRYLPPEARIHQVHNAIDVPQAMPVAAGSNRCITYVGRLDEEKGVRLLADAASTRGIDVLFVGEGPLRAELENRPGVTVTGWVSPDEVARHLANARCLVSPSLWFEAFVLVVDEAAARGVPSIVSDISAAAERVEDGVSGWHFRSGDADALAGALQKTLNDAAVQAAGEAAYRRFWRDARTGPAHAASLLAIYRSIMSNTVNHAAA